MSRVDHIRGHTFHGRRGAVDNAFRYAVDYVIFDPETPPEGLRLFRRNRRGLMAVQDRDHGGPVGQGRGAAFVREALAAESIAIPGLRLGYLTGAAQHIQTLKQYLPNWTVNSIAQAVGAQAVQDTEYLQRSRDFVTRQRAALQQELAGLPGLTVYPGEANFLLVRLDHARLDARQLAELTLQQGIALRLCDNFKGLDQRYF
ncbi:aminotransferase class I/II-fold pyridoxal phosphate-dependent enzyme, partial [Candidatus Falkowbacteria bacterium]|nr:aminotransferase class I/II-fold pyridoxal phosphate-dependent enzyme [Candidatus Falkowbacteria bacterium]